MDALPTLPPAADEATQQHYSNTLDPPFLVPDAENDNGRPYSEHYERIDFMTNGDLAWLNEGHDADNNNTTHEPNEQGQQQRSVRRGLDLGLTGSDFNATLTGNTKTGTAATATASRFARRLRPIVSRALLDLEQPVHETNHSGIQRCNTSHKEDVMAQDVSGAAPESEQRLLSRSAENTLWGRSHDRIAALQETLRGTQSRHPLFLLTHTSHVTDEGNIERGTSAAHSESSSESIKQKVQLSPSGILLEAGLDSVTQRTQRALARLYATKDVQGALPAFGPRKAQENHLRATLAFLTQQQQELADHDNEDNVIHNDNSVGLVGNTEEAQAGVSSPPSQDKPHVATTTQQQQQQQSLRFEPLTMSAIRRRFGPPAMLSARVTPSVVSVLSLCSRASSLLRDDVRHEDDEEDNTNKRYDALHKTGRLKAGAAGSPLYAQGQARQAMRRYVGYLHTPDSVLRELAQKAQQPTRTPNNNNNNNSVSSRVQRPRAKLCATMPFLNETLRDTRVLHAAKQAIVLDKIGLHKSGRQVVQDAMQATQALLRNHQQRRSSQERLAHEVRQWCDRTVLVTTTIMNVPQDKYNAAAESTSNGGVVVFEDDPNEGYERDMRRIALEEAEVRMRNLLQRRRRIETQPGQTLATTTNNNSHTTKANTVNSNAGVSSQIDLQDHRRLCARFTPWGTFVDAEDEDKDTQSTLHGSRTEANVTRYGEEGKWQSADMSPHARPTKRITYNNTTGNEEEDSKTPLLTNAEEGLLALVVFAVSRAGTLFSQTRHYETRTSLVKQLQEAVQADKTALARRGRPSFFTTTTTPSSPSSSHATQYTTTTTTTPVPQESNNSDNNKEEERDMLGYVYLKGIGSNGHDLRCLRELDTLLLAQEHETETATTCVPQVVPVLLYCNTNVSASNIVNSRTSPCPSSPSIMTPSHRRNYSSQATPCKDIVCPVDALELLYALPAVTVQALLEQTTRTTTTTTSQGSGLSAGFQLNLSRSVQQLWRRVLRQYLQTRHHHRSHPSHDGSSNGVESTVSNTTKDELRVVGFCVDVAAAIATSRWRARTLKRIADALHTRLQATMAAAAAAMGSRMSLMHSSPSTPTPTQTEQQEPSAQRQKDTTRDTTRHEHHPSMMGLLSYGMEHRPTPSISSSSPCAHKGSVIGQRGSNHGSEACEDDAQAMLVGPQMINDIPFAPPTRACYPLDMRNLYVRATLAAEECDGTLRTRLTRLVQRYRDLCTTITNSTTSSSETGVSLATNLQRWASVQQLYDLEANYAQTLSTFYEHECTVHEFNAHVGHYNAFQIREGRIWGPLYRSSLCISYLLCKYLSLHGLEQLPEDYVALLHPVALFLGCSGGHREIRVKLPERMVDILERAKRVRLHLESMPWKAQEERQLAEAVKVVGQCGQPARIVTCLATEEDVLFVPLTIVAGPQHDFTELPHLV